VESGHDEHLVMVAFLHLVAESEAGKILEHQVRPRILKAHVTEAPEDAVMDAAGDVLEAWEHKRMGCAHAADCVFNPVNIRQCNHRICHLV